MDSNDSQAAETQVQIPSQVIGGEAEGAFDASLDSSSQVGSAAWQAEILEKLKYTSPEQLLMSYQQQLIEFYERQQSSQQRLIQLYEQQLIEQQQQLKLQQCLLRRQFNQWQQTCQRQSGQLTASIFLVMLLMMLCLVIQSAHDAADAPLSLWWGYASLGAIVMLGLNAL